MHSNPPKNVCVHETQVFSKNYAKASNAVVRVNTLKKVKKFYKFLSFSFFGAGTPAVAISLLVVTNQTFTYGAMQQLYRRKDAL